MAREEGMFMCRQEDIDHHGDGCTEMTDTISIISLTYLITDQESSLTEAVLQDLIMVSIMENGRLQGKPNRITPNMRSSTRVNAGHRNAASFNRGGSVGGRIQGGQRGGRR